LDAFAGCTGLTSITIPGSVVDVGEDAFYYCTSLARAAMLNGVTSLGFETFAWCTSLTSVTVPASVTSIGNSAFAECASLQGVFFAGVPPTDGRDVFFGDNNATIYSLAGATGWDSTFSGVPALLWNPLMHSSVVGPAGFGFNITGTVDIPIVIEAATNL